MTPVRNLLQKLRGATRGALPDEAGAFVEAFDLEGAKEGPLAGLTFGAKDIFDVAGRRTGCGNPDWAAMQEPAGGHAAAVAACLEAGALLRGKTHTDELAYSLMGANSHYGTPRNPAAPGRLPGGTSSGSAAATAAGSVTFALGSDTGGSVRVPGSFCGLYGLRTTHGRVPVEGMVPLAPSFDVVGWFAANTWVMAAVAEVLDPAATQAIPRPRLFYAEDAWALADASTAAALRPSVDRLAEILGPAEPLQLADTSLADWREVFRVCQAAEAWEVHGEWITANTPVFGPGVSERFAAASRITGDEHAAAQAQREAVRQRLSGLLGDDAVVILPTCPGPAPRRDADVQTLEAYRAAALQLLCPAGLGGLPQLTLHAGPTAGAPVGLSLLGPAGSDRTLLDIAARLELCMMLPYAVM